TGFSVTDKATELFFAVFTMHADFLFFLKAKSIVRKLAAFVAVLSRRIRAPLEGTGFSQARQFHTQTTLNSKTSNFIRFLHGLCILLKSHLSPRHIPIEHPPCKVSQKGSGLFFRPETSRFRTKK